MSFFLQFWSVVYQLTQGRLSHVNTFNSREGEYLDETSSKIPKKFQNKIKMIHLKWAEKQKGPIKTIIDNEILAPKDALTMISNALILQMKK